MSYYDNLRTRLFLKAAPFLEQGFDVDVLTDTKVELVKKFPAPRTERRYSFEISGSTICNRMARYPGQCERCGKKQVAYNVKAENKPDADWITCCFDCFKEGEPTALVEWNWTDIDGAVGFSGFSPASASEASSQPYNPPQGGAEMLHTIKEIKEKNAKDLEKAEQLKRLIEGIEELQGTKIVLHEKNARGEQVWGHLSFSKDCIPLGQHFNEDQFRTLTEDMNEAVREVLEAKIAELKEKLNDLTKAGWRSQ